MTDAWVVNASPVIVLAKAGHLELLDEPGTSILVPDAVAAELLAGPASDPARLAVEGGWGERLPAADIPPGILEWSLGPGESSVLAAALQRPGSVAILDDGEGRACARALGVAVMGTLGIVLRAQRLGRIESASRILRGLREAGLYLHDDVVAEALRRVTGESWK